MPERVQLETLSIRSDPVRFRDARGWVSDAARAAGLSDDDVHAVAVAISEVCSNVHRHAYGGRKDGRIDLRAEIEDGLVRLTVRDYGIAFDRSTYRLPKLVEPAEGGYGIFLIRNLMDTVEYTDTGVGTQVTLVKSRHSAGAGR